MRLLYGAPPASEEDIAKRAGQLADEFADFRDVMDYFGASLDEMKHVSLGDLRELAVLIRAERSAR